ncbi:MAG: IS21-like element helper ATPase IstB [Clostridia bacterium]|nr:IS21-like element helper ATPase IstB [Clostridia bacterium]
MIDQREEQIKLLAKQMKLPTFANYNDILRQAKPGADFSDLLLDLLMAEAAARQENQTRRRLKAAAFPYQKTLDEFDFTQLNESVSPVFIQELASCKFIDEHKNIVMIGNPGRGKTHISIALGVKACLQGYRVLFKNAGSLSTELTEARDSYQLGRIERSLDKTDLLILDELSYMSFNKYESELLFKVISERSERASTIVTTNLPFSRWTELFESSTMVSALVDRLTFRSHVLDMSGPSYRLLSTQANAAQ